MTSSQVPGGIRRRRRRRPTGAPRHNGNALRGATRAYAIRQAVSLAVADSRGEMPTLPICRLDIAKLRTQTGGAVQANERRLAHALAEQDGLHLPRAWTLRRMGPVGRLRLRVLNLLGLGIELATAYAGIVYGEGKFGRFLDLVDTVGRMEKRASEVEGRVLSDLAISSGSRRHD